MKYKIISDSSSNIFTLESVPFSSVPLHIIIDEKNFTDNESVDLQALDTALSKGHSSGTACPSIGDWLDAFGDAENIFCVTITSSLSGCFSSAQMAKEDYEEQHPNRHVYIIDSLSVGPEMVLIIEKLQELILSGMDSEKIYQAIRQYTQRTHLLFSLESLRNMAKNGRVSPTVAKLAGLLGIRIIGKASDQGELQVLSKSRGEQRALSSVIKYMQKEGYNGGKIRIAHSQNETAAQSLMNQLKDAFPSSDIHICPTWALCSYYAEKGGLLIGFES